MSQKQKLNKKQNKTTDTPTQIERIIKIQIASLHQVKSQNTTNKLLLPPKKNSKNKIKINPIHKRKANNSRFASNLYAHLVWCKKKSCEKIKIKMENTTVNITTRVRKQQSKKKSQKTTQHIKV